jgi:ATP-dependent 26S proteasome regulatory subunit
MPDAAQRLRLWEGMLNGRCRLADDVRLATLAEEYELSGGAITNVVRYGAIRALQRTEPMITHGDLRKGIAKERFKEGKTM